MIAGGTSTAGSTGINPKQKKTDLEGKRRKRNDPNNLNFPSRSMAPHKEHRKDKNRAVPGMMDKSWSAGMQFTPVSGPAAPPAYNKPTRTKREPGSRNKMKGAIPLPVMRGMVS